MAKLSRRKLIAGAAAAPLAAGAARVNGGARKGRQAKSDPVVAEVAAWLAQHDAHDAMAREWSRLESAMWKRVKGALDLTQARRSRLPEACAMRVLDKRIAQVWKKLKRDAGRIVLMRTTTTAGALAKIEMAMRIQGPYDWNDHAYALMQDGCEQLALKLADEA